MTGYGAGWQDETGQYINANTPEMIEAMNFIKDTYLDEAWAPMLPPGVLAWNDISTTKPSRRSYRLHGKCGNRLCQGSGRCLPVAEKTAIWRLPADLSIKNLTHWQQRLAYSVRVPRTLRTQSRQFSPSPPIWTEWMLCWLLPAYALPAYTNLWDMSEYTQSNEMSLQVKPAALDDSGIIAGQWPGPPSPALTAIENSGIWNDMVNAFITGTPVEEAVATAQERMVQVFKEFDLPGEK
ncbi:MAG: hypothetical protein R2867_44040 [Caldilineaceae bacterium]